MDSKIDMEIHELSDKLKIFDKMYETLRFVDPVRKKVIKIDGEDFTEEDENCFEIWRKSKICDNCISVRAYNENQTFVKVEYSPQKIYMITAVPVELKNRLIIIELLKDTTNSMLLGNGDYQSNVEIHSLINKLNIAALKDGLTNAYNRRYINERLPVDMVNSTILNQDISLILCDLDHFKKVNDNFGHVAGDQVLVKFTQVLEGCIRRNDDWVARYGGEEFLVCLPNTNIEGASSIAERMRKTMQDNEFYFSDEAVKVTASFGVCNIKELSNVNVETFIECADKKLYEAKRLGRNRVCF